MEVLIDAIKQGIAPAIIVAIYLVIIKLIDNKKDRLQIKLTTELTSSINNISLFLTNVTKNIIDKDKTKCKYAIESTMYSAGMRLTNFVSNTITNNHIDANKDNILASIDNIVNSEYYSIYSVLSLYIFNDCKVSDYLDKEWMTSMKKDIIDIIYNNVLSKEDRISSFSNKVTIKFQTYITYIMNHIDN